MFYFIRPDQFNPSFCGQNVKKKIGAGGRNKNKNIMNFQNITLVFKRV